MKMPDKPPVMGMIPIPDPTILTTQQLVGAVSSLREILEARIFGMEKLIEQLVKQEHGLNTLIENKLEALTQIQNEKFRSIEIQFKERDTRNEQTTRDNRLAVDAALQAAKEAGAAIDEKTAHLQALHGERFHSISTQFIERDVRTEQTSRDSKVAVDAALQAAKEAVGEQNRSSALAIAKSEAATVKQIDQQGLLIQTATGALNDKIEDIKDRLTRIEGMGVGQINAQTASQVEKQAQQGVQNLQQGSNTLMVAIVVGIVGGIAGIGGLIVAISKLF